MKLFITKFLACLLLSVLVYSSANTQSNNGNECEFNEPIFLTDVFNYIPSADCHTFVDDSYYVSSEEIISHPDGSSLNLICGPSNGFTTIQSATFVDLNPGFNSGDGVFAGFEARIAPCDSGCPTVGMPCDDGDECTVNDAYDSSCNCVGTFSDADGDGLCTAEDCDDTDASIGGVGSTCDDSNVCTINDAYDSSCNCVGTFSDIDGDGVCTVEDCDDTDASIGGAGSTCDDGDMCTVNDAYDSSCNCVGTFSDSDGDGLCTAEDCDDTDATIGGEGSACDDGDDCTVGETYNNSCQCSGGIFQDSDNDGICDMNDLCPNNPSSNIEEFTVLVGSQNVNVEELSGLTYNDSEEEFFAISDDGQWLTRDLIGQSWDIRTFDNFIGGGHCSGDHINRFTDGEAVCYISSNSDQTQHKYAVSDERDRTIIFVDVFDDQTSIPFPTTYLRMPWNGICDNSGIEGLAYDQNSNTMYYAIERDSQKIYSFTVPSNINGQLINATDDNLQEVVDFSDFSNELNSYSTHGLDVMPNGNIIALITNNEFTPSNNDNGDFSRKIVEFDPCGELLGQIDVEPTIPNSAELEGITVANDDIYLIGEFSVFYRLSRQNTATLTNNEESVSELRNSVSTESFIGESNVSIYPNPFSDQVKIELDLISDERVQIDVFDLQGKLIKNIMDRKGVQQGHHVFDIEASELNSGLYFIKVQAGDFIETKKITKL